VVTFSSQGGSLDTVLAIYAYEQELEGDGAGPEDPEDPFDDLEEVGRSDDSPGEPAVSSVQIGVRQGVRYAIAVDGFNGASGPFTLTWNLLPSSGIVPVILFNEPDRALRQGDTLTLTLQFPPLADVDFVWYRDDEELDDDDDDGDDDDDDDDTNGTLVIRDFSAADVGTYRVLIQLDDVEFFSAPVEIQLNSEGEILSLARDKLAHALESALIGASLGGVALSQPSRPSPRLALATLQPHALPIGVTRGVNGSQIFSTAYARRDPEEPVHCGVEGGASYWFAYVPPAHGTLTLDTLGTSFDTVLAIYTFTPPLAGYPDLIPVECNDNAHPDALTSQVAFAVAPNQTYLVAVDGVRGARGVVHLHYQLLPDPAWDPPLILSPPSDLTASIGGPVEFTVRTSGKEPFSYQWQKDGQDLDRQDQPTLVLPSVGPQDAGAYSVVVHNAHGAVVSAPATLRIRPDFNLRFAHQDDRLLVSFVSARGWRYVAEAGPDPQPASWSIIGTRDGTGDLLTFTNLPDTADARFFRVRAE
jgi:hypothetical protein